MLFPRYPGSTLLCDCRALSLLGAQPSFSTTDELKYFEQVSEVDPLRRVGLRGSEYNEFLNSKSLLAVSIRFLLDGLGSCRVTGSILSLMSFTDKSIRRGSLQPTLMEGFQLRYLVSTLVYLRPEGMLRQLRFYFSIWQFIINVCMGRSNKSLLCISVFIGMAKYFWFYIVLQVLILLLIVQAWNKHMHLTGIIEKGASSTVDRSRQTTVVSKECVKRDLISGFKRLQGRMENYIRANGYDQSLRGREQTMEIKVTRPAEDTRRVTTTTTESRTVSDSQDGKTQTQNRRQTTHRYEMRSD